MFGVMGIGGAFINAAGRGGRKSESDLVLRYNVADPTIYQLSCDGEITVESVKNGAPIVQTYSNLNDSQTSIQSDANTDIIIKGNVTKIKLYHYDDDSETEYGNKRAINIAANSTLQYLECFGCDQLTSLDLSKSAAIEYLNCSSCTQLTSLDLSKSAAIEYLNCYGDTKLRLLNISKGTKLTNPNLVLINCKALAEIYYPATDSGASTAIANAITAATAADGTVYTDSAGAYYSTIETAAQAKGWTIEQL